MTAHLSDWRTNNPSLHPGRWIGAFICAIVIYYIAMGLLGSMLN